MYLEVGNLFAYYNYIHTHNYFYFEVAQNET